MRFALLNESKVEAVPGIKEAVCPGCRTVLVPKCGEIVCWHWAHKAHRDCDSWWEPETLWHREWKDRLTGNDPSLQEVVVGSHRADVRFEDGLVVEVQHSSIDPQTIRDREQFYDSMVWLFDARNWRLEPEPYPGVPEQNPAGAPLPYHGWVRPRRSLFECTKPLILDCGETALILPEGCTPPFLAREVPCSEIPQVVRNLPTVLKEILEEKRARETHHRQLREAAERQRQEAEVERQRREEQLQRRLREQKERDRKANAAARSIVTKRFPILRSLAQLLHKEPDLDISKIKDALIVKHGGMRGGAGHPAVPVRWEPGPGLSPKQANWLLWRFQQHGITYERSGATINPSRLNQLADMPEWQIERLGGLPLARGGLTLPKRPQWLRQDGWRELQRRSETSAVVAASITTPVIVNNDLDILVDHLLD